MRFNRIREGPLLGEVWKWPVRYPATREIFGESECVTNRLLPCVWGCDALQHVQYSCAMPRNKHMLHLNEVMFDHYECSSKRCHS